MIGEIRARALKAADELEGLIRERRTVTLDKSIQSQDKIMRLGEIHKRFLAADESFAAELRALADMQQTIKLTAGSTLPANPHLALLALTGE